jgi:hypothetical protein
MLKNLSVTLKNECTGFLVLSIGFFLLSCRFSTQPVHKPGSDSQYTDILSSPKVSEFRDHINSQPVAQYKTKTDNRLNDWYFSVLLFETPKTFEYVLKIQFEEVRGIDSLEFPNFGLEPRPVLKKGEGRYACIVGFMDRKGQFHEYKKVFVKEDGTLSVRTLNRFRVGRVSGN